MNKPEDYLELEELELSFSQLYECPEWISECINLKELYLNNNYLENCDGIKFPESLEILDISNNKLTKFPICNKLLKKLHLSGNEITYIPNILPENLVCLNISFNYIAVISNDLVLPPSLTILNLSNNRIRSIPINIWNHPTLRTLSLSYNNIDTIPRGVILSPILEHIGLYGNKISSEINNIFNGIYSLRGLNEVLF